MSLNSDSQQFHQYQQNEQSPLILTLNGKKLPQHTTEIKILAGDIHKNV